MSSKECIATPDISRAPLFENVAGALRYFGVPVEVRPVVVGDSLFEIASLCDAADLLDHPAFAERFIKDDIAPYGLQLWDSAIQLADLVVGREVSGRAIELGCGVGLVSIVLAHSGWDVWATDIDPAALSFAAHNAKQNGVRFTRLELLDWHRLQIRETFNLVVGSDLTYQAADHEPLLRSIRSLLAPEGIAFLCDPKRAISDSIPERARRLNLNVRVLSQASASSVRIWSIRRNDEGTIGS